MAAIPAVELTDPAAASAIDAEGPSDDRRPLHGPNQFPPGLLPHCWPVGDGALAAMEPP